MSKVRGWVYVITNPAMPNILKIGFSTKDPQLRAQEFYHTNSPHPFIVEYDVLVESPRNFEQLIHKELSHLNEGKEWFRCSVSEAVSAIREIIGNEIILENLKHNNDIVVDRININIEYAKRGDPDAQCSLGNAYYNGYGISQDSVQALYWYQKAAEQGNVDAQYNLGNAYFNDSCTNRDYKKAFYWYKKAAENGDPDAQCSLGNAYYNGYGISQDSVQAFYWYQKAAKKGDPNAQHYLGLMYRDGFGVAQDFLQAFYWYQKAAKQGDPSSQCNLGLIYQNGLGIAQDSKLAFIWYQKAAEQGNVDAQYNLGNAYFNGEGVNQDYELASKWFIISNTKYADASNKLTILTNLMTTKQIERAQILASDWIKDKKR
jgi:TPR repeat protein